MTLPLGTLAEWAIFLVLLAYVVHVWQMAAQPKPKHTKTVCTVCGLSWEAHGAKPTLETCIRLLKAELKKPPKLPWVQYGGTSGRIIDYTPQS